MGLAYLHPQFLLRHDIAIGKGPLRHLFQHGVQRFIELLTSKAKPCLVVPCMIYFPCVKGLVV
jgi:hypothetical protein